MLYLSFATFLAAVISAASVPKIQQTKHLKIDFSVLRGDSHFSAVEGGEASLMKREGSTELILINQKTYYAATLKVGSHGANNTVVVDTGSSDLWIMSSDVDCQYNPSPFKRSIDDITEFSHRRLMDFEIPQDPSATDKEKRADIVVTTIIVQTDVGSTSGSGSGSCTASGSLDTAKSNSFKINSTAPPFSITYADQTYAEGYWGTDYIDFGALNVSDCSFAVVNSTSSNTGVFGIGFAGLETTFSGTGAFSPYQYENFPLRLKATGAINKVLYSLYLNTAAADSGSVLFGAVDHAKYTGELQTVPIINIYPQHFKTPIRFDIVLDSITLESSSQNVTVSTSHIPALLDSGTTLTYLPTVMLNSLVSSLGGVFRKNQGLYEVSCSYNSKSAYAVFNFSGVEIKVPFSDLIMSRIMSSGRKCYLGILPQTPDKLSGVYYAVLGDNFLRNAYIVYDLEDYEISLAQAKYSTDEDIEIVSSTVPSAAKAPRYSETAIVSSVASQGSTPLSSSGFKKSGASKKVCFARSALLGIMGVCALLIV